MVAQFATVEDEARYEAGVQRAIRRNAMKSRARKLEAFAEAHPAVVDFLRSNTFRPEGFGELMCSFQSQLETFGQLSEKQVAVVEKAIARRAESRAKAQAARAEKAETAEWVGEPGERRVFQLTVKSSSARDGSMGTYWMNLAEDEAGNVVVYRGNRWEPGAQITVRATIKRLDTYQGLKQTVVGRPKILG